MSLVRPICACCGAATEALAVVMDPFSDSCYGVCAACMEPINRARGVEIAASLSRFPEPGVGE